MVVVFLSGFLIYISLGESNASKKTFTLAIALFFAIFAGYKVYQQDIDKSKAIDRLSRVGSNIIWDEVKVKYLGIDSPNELNGLKLTAAIKIGSRVRSSYGDKIDFEKILERAKPIHAYDLKLLQHDDAVSLYTSYANDKGITVVRNETDANIHTLMFHTESSDDSFTYDVVNTLKYEYGANARTSFRSLYDLNDSFIIFDIRANEGKKLNPGAVYLELKSNLGFDVIPIQTTTQMLEQYNARMIIFGVYIPENYWTLE
ncbi:hypothetical protein BCV44_09375 [Vibrio cyclitrophicus]|uniref:hypothetical protein n=1 Tax=Vibrio cyclitrophicus TaxID=47951 RepID=UPI000C833584|nr:hypothetical protein [Vibrio cyclitrophicus]PME19355.1 hypothetical protein BCV44_09375 [Vibrio cyclitrophicus]